MNHEADRANSDPNDATPALRRLAQLEGFLRQDPDNAGLLHEAFEAALAAGAPDAAEFHLVHALALGADPWRWSLNGLHLDFARGRWASATARLAALRARPDAPAGLADALDHAAVFLALSQGRTEEALAALEPLLARRAAPDAPLAPATQTLVLRALHHGGQLARALAWAHARAARGALAVPALGAAALIALDAGDLAAAAGWARAAQAADAAGPDACVVASNLALAAGDAAGAEAHARRALVLDEHQCRAWAALGLAQMRGRQLAQAEASLERAVAGMRWPVGNWLALGWTQMLQGKLEAAQRTLEEAVTLDRNFSECHGCLAAAQARAGRTEAARTSLERALRLDRECASAQYARLVLEGRAGAGSPELEQLAARVLATAAKPRAR